MSVAHQFLYGKDQGPRDLEQFISDNFQEIISIFRVIEAQHETTREKKENAHKELNEIRKKEQMIRKKKIILSDVEKLELSERKEELMAIREENDIIYYNGEPLHYNYVVMLIKKYKPLIKVAERADFYVRKGIAKTVKFGVGPISNIIKEKFKDIDIAKTFESIIMGDAEVDLSQHRPK